MTDEEVAQVAQGFAEGLIIRLGHSIRALRERDGREVTPANEAAICVTACTTAAVALAAVHNCVDAPSAVALIHCIAESAAADIYEAEA